MQIIFIYTYILMSTAAAIAAGTSGLLDNIIMSLNTSPYVASTMMLFLNFGGRFLGLELTKGQEKFFTHPYVRRFLIFCVMFVATRNILIAAWMAILIILIVGYLTNENSALCLFGSASIPNATCSKAEGFEATPGSSGLTPEEESILKMLLDKKNRSVQAAATVDKIPQKKNRAAAYKSNISKIGNM
jgi:hypothetical protein